MIARVLIFAFLASVSRAADFNVTVLGQIEGMPRGGRYATDLAAHKALDSAVSLAGGSLVIEPEKAAPGYCSGATYLVFLLTVRALNERGAIALDPPTLDALRPRLRPDNLDTTPDGEEIWGRWNANGPGTARLFFLLQLGKNFTDFSQAKAGDFMKIFWTDAVGKNERGHSVIYLGTERRAGREYIEFWSSNQPEGFGRKSVPRESIKWAIFSRLEQPKNLSRWRKLEETDAYLSGLLRSESTRSEAERLSGIRE